MEITSENYMDSLKRLMYLIESEESGKILTQDEEKEINELSDSICEYENENFPI